MNEHEQNIEVMKDLRNKLDKVLQDKTQTLNVQPKDPSKGHFYVSLVKSFLRITGFVTLFLAGANPEMMTSWLKVTAGFLMLAECLGILEELV